MVTTMKSAVLTSVVAAFFAIVLCGAAAAEAPKRIVSINMCADELLLALADPGQIVGLSPFAADPAMSFLADKALNYRHDVASAEAVVGLDPDLVLANDFNDPATLAMLTRLGYRLERIDAPRSIDQSIAEIRKVAALVGHPERGAALVAKIEAALKAARAAAKGRPHPTAVVYQRRGYVTGGDTLTGELLSIAGFRNDGGALAGKTGGFVSLETLVANHPDTIVVTTPDPRAVDQGNALLTHPALVALYPRARRIVLPQRLTVCGGPSLPAALARVTREAVRVERNP